jgi:hypothetical protein
MKALILEIALSTICTTAFCQGLKPEELMALSNQNLTAIDSVMEARSFIKQTVSEGTSYSIFTYTYTSESGAFPVRRSLHLGLRPGQHMLQLEYGVWQKDEASGFIQALLRAGFKKTIREMTGIDDSGTVEFVGYKRDADYIAYREMNRGSRLYIFTLDNDHYKP